jgi:hypothetical protein
VTIEIRRNACNQLECDWGVFNNAEADPLRELEPLVLITDEWVVRLLGEGPHPNPRGGLTTVTHKGHRIFAHLDFEGTRTTWELFEAHWWDGVEHPKVYVGRWPD